MKSKRRFIPLVFLGAIILSLLLVIPAFSATGEVRFYIDADDDQEWARQGGEVALEVKDGDLDEDVDDTQTFEAGMRTVNLRNIPVADKNNDGFVNRLDVTLVGLDDQPISGVSVDRAGVDGRVDLTEAPTVGFKISYTGAIRNNTGGEVTDGEVTGGTVRVKSQADPSGIVVSLQETKPNSGIFQLTIDTNSDESDDDANRLGTDNYRPSLKVGKDDQVTLTYKDADPKRTASKILKVESTAPTFSSLSPAHGSAGRANPEVEFNVTDGGSGLGEDEDDDIQVIFGIDTDDSGVINFVIDRNPDTNGSLNAIDGGFHVRQRLPSDPNVGPNAVVYWWAVAVDAAGNKAVSDRKAKLKKDDVEENDPCNDLGHKDTKGAFPDSVDGVNVNDSFQIGGCQPYKIEIDNEEPVIASVRTGAFWDTSNKDDDDKTNTDASKAKPDMVLVTFDGGLNAETVEADDFEVNDKVPSSAMVYSGAKQNVFLTLSSDLDPDAKPKVEIVGSIEDLAGNRQTSDDMDATDGIAPTLTVSVEGGNRAVTNGEIKIMISSNEDVGNVNVAFQKVVDSGLGDDEETEDVNEALDALESATNVSAVLKSARNYEATYTAPDSGLYNVYVTADDVSTPSNEGKSGVNKGPIDLTDDTKAILFEFDNAVSEPMVMPDDDTGSDNSDPFITIDFADEGKEYEDLKEVDLDSHGTVTIVSASLDSPNADAMDIAGSLATTDNVIFLYKASDLVKGNHKVTVKAKDAAGNEAEFEKTVKIVEREPFSLKLKPGWNLVSLPGTPTNTSINAVIPADHPASTILSYDAEAGWTTAIRSEDGTWLGTLMTVDASSAYWIQTDTFDPIKVDIPRISAGTSVPPTISLMAGWNFVPVVDVTGDMGYGDKVDAKAYFSGTKVNRVYSFNTLQGMWEVVDLESGSLMVGYGYWAHASEDGVLAP